MVQGRAKAILDAAGRADRSALARLVQTPDDANGIWRGYRPLHALIQEKPHGEDGSPPKERLDCLAWLLDHGADPELTGAWPPARALLIAAFVGSRAYVERLLEAGAKRDLFSASALGDLAGVKRTLAKDPILARARTEGGLKPVVVALAKGRAKLAEILIG